MINSLNTFLIQKNLLILVIFFIFSRVLIYVSGVTFDHGTLYQFWQYIDIDLLKYNLIESLFYLHSQPPLFNLFLGIGVKLFPDSYPVFFNFVYLIISFGIYTLLFRILISFGLRPLTSLFLATLFIISPEAILYENWLFYTWIVTYLIILSAFFFMRYEQTLQSKYALYFLITITVIALTRTSFHLILVCAAIIFLILVPSKERKKIFLYSAIPIVFVIALYMKNFILFDTFGSSSWMGMNVLRIANASIKDISKEELYKEKKINRITKIGGFQDIDKYPSEYTAIPRKYQNISVLSSEYKPSSHPLYDTYKDRKHRNFNHFGYIEISKIMKNDSKIIIEHNFNGYLNAVKHAWIIYSKPSWDYFLIKRNYAHIQQYSKLFSFSHIRFTIEKYLLPEKQSLEFPYSSLLLIPLSMMIVLIFLISILPKKTYKLKYTFLYMGFIIFSLAVIGNSLEIGENNRFRVMTDPLLYILTIVAISTFLQKRKWV